MLLAGDTFYRFRIEGKLGEGGMGLVYRAYDTMLRRQVALKVVRPEVAQTAAATRLMREGRAAASLNHPNAIGIFDIGSFEGIPYIVMELVSGHLLSAYIGDERVRTRQRLSWLAQIARGLDAAHQQGLVHRDVKPENVMVCETGEIKLFDFGVVKRMANLAHLSNTTDSSVVEKTRTGFVMGTPLYMAPEQALGDAVDGRSDQFSWGTLAYELLSGGIHPATTNNPRRLPIAFAILREQPRSLSEIAPRLPDGVAAIVMKALGKAPSSRFATMTEIYTALDAIIRKMDDAAGRSTAPVTAKPVRKGRFRHVGLAAAALGLVAVLLFLSHVFYP